MRFVDRFPRRKSYLFVVGRKPARRVHGRIGHELAVKHLLKRRYIGIPVLGIQRERFK